ncbi:MAG TPA: hypothetical protein VM427_00110 [Patescibacteria group bacterium]|nr:hypothetical protein [Patescibacteria group bacterium]
MILRVVSGRVSPGAVDRVSASYETAYVPIAEQTVGLVRFVVAVESTPDGGHDLAALTVWATVDHALAAYGGNLSALRTLDAVDHGERMTKVDYFELDESTGADIGGDRPTLLRIAVGRVARGLDADIQQQLRRRLPDLPGEACEAWIGRRVLEGDVEIAFVSTWTRAPAEPRLGEALWPVISDRYAEFGVSLLSILVEGVGRG